MSSYLVLKSARMTAAYLTVVLFSLGLLLDAVGRPDRLGDSQCQCLPVS